MRRDYYAVLGVTATAGSREIRQAYRRLARQYSPDVNFWDTRARALFDEIAEAYRVLSDPGARQLYDRGAVRAGGDGADAARRGDDVHVSVQIDFADVARGVTLEVAVPRFSPCEACHPGETGPRRPCAACGGRGVQRRLTSVPVAIPAGADTATQVRVPGEGHAGPYGGPRGDLLVSIHVRPHPFFVRKGHNVHCEVPISVWEALRGARIRIPTPTGEGVVVLPPGTSSGTVVRLRGQGLPRLSGEGPGDLYLTLRLEVPGGVDARTNELVRELERLLPMNPRDSLDRYRGGAA